ncbi:MAG: hypothetical protein ACYTKD_21290, partial [Planctomycetota bacterium]
MIDLPDQPEGSRIKALVGEKEIRFRWKNSRRRVNLALLPAVLVAVACGALGVLSILDSGEFQGDMLFFLLMAFVYVLAVLALASGRAGVSVLRLQENRLTLVRLPKRLVRYEGGELYPNHPLGSIGTVEQRNWDRDVAEGRNSWKEAVPKADVTGALLSRGLLGSRVVIRVMLHPHSGWPQEAPQRGAFTQGKPRWGSLSVAHIQFH